MFLKKKKPRQQNSLSPVLPPEIDSAIPAPKFSDMPEPGSTRLQKRPKKEKGQTSLQPLEPEEETPKTEPKPRKKPKTKWPVLIAVGLVLVLAAGLCCGIFLRSKPPAPEKDDLKQQYLAAEELSETNPGQAAIAFYKLGDYKDARQRSFALWDKIAQRKTICSADYHIAAVKNDGSVLLAADTSVDRFDYLPGKPEATPVGLENVENWTDIIALDTTTSCIVGLKADGTVVAAGANTYGECDVSGWTDIVSVVTNNSSSIGGYNQTIGLKADGTVVIAGVNPFGALNWTDIVKIFSGPNLLVGLKADGTVVAVGGYSSEAHTVSDWTDITDICVTYSRIAGLKKDGTVLFTANSLSGGYTDTKWSDIAAIFDVDSYTCGIKTDGTLVFSPNPGYDMTELTDIAAVIGSPSSFVCLKTDGTVLAPWAWVTATDQPLWATLDGWTDIVAIYDVESHSYGGCFIGLKADGTVKFKGYIAPAVFGQTLPQWSDIKLPAK